VGKLKALSALFFDTECLIFSGVRCVRTHDGRDTVPQTLQHEEKTAEPGPAGEDALRFRRCAWCRSATEHSRTLCRVCGSADLDEECSRGSGAISWTTRVVHTQDLVHRIRQTCFVALDEGFTVPATVEAQAIEALPTGTRVRLAGLVPGNGTEGRAGSAGALFVPA
jgi:hypothetical protein